MKKIFVLILPFFTLCCNIGLFVSTPPKFPAEGNIDLTISNFVSSNAVEFLRASEARDENDITISWSEFPGADYYIIERANIKSRNKINVADSTWVVLDVNPTTCEYIDTNVTSTESYYAYRVKAYSRRLAQYSKYSNISYGSLLSPPSQVSASKGRSHQHIEINFQKVPGSSGYNIYKMTDGIVDSTPVNSTPVLNSNAQDTVTYYYEPSEKEKGEKISFVVKTISGSNEKKLSIATNACIGYTKLSKSPDAPTDFQASKALSTTQISISFSISEFDKSNSDIKWTVYRVNEGAGESERTTLYPEQAQNGIIYWIDDDRLLKENVEYTYSLVPESKYGKGEAVTSVGYLFSTPVAVDLTPLNNLSRCGYILDITPPVGASECPQFGYKVIQEFADGTKNEKIYPVNETVFYNCARNVLEESELYSKEIRAVEVRLVDTTSPELESVRSVSARIGSVPETVTNLSASKNYYSVNLGNKNSDGLYPVYITWKSEIEPAKVVLHRSDGTEINVKDGSLGEGQYCYYDKTTELGKKYSYTIECFDKLGRSKGKSALIDSSKDAYGALDPVSFMELFEFHCLKPWTYYGHPEYRTNPSYNKIYDKVSKASMSSLTDGKAITVKGMYQHGNSTIAYSSNSESDGGQIKGWVKFEYNNFGECDYMWISGKASYRMLVAMSGSGEITSSDTFYVVGMYPAVINFNDLKIETRDFVGHYNVTMRYSNGNVGFRVSR